MTRWSGGLSCIRVNGEKPGFLRGRFRIGGSPGMVDLEAGLLHVKRSYCPRLRPGGGDGAEIIILTYRPAFSPATGIASPAYPPARAARSSAMKCPFCSADNDRVIDSRVSQEGDVTRRRRECVDCHRRFTTYERWEAIQTKVVKKDGCREDFDKEKIRRGLEKACWKRPIASDDIEKIVSAVETEIHDRLEPEIESREVGDLVMDQLRSVDQVAFVRFASVYREFKDVADFVDELQPILRERRQAARQSRGPRGGESQ